MTLPSVRSLEALTGGPHMPLPPARRVGLYPALLRAARSGGSIDRYAALSGPRARAPASQAASQDWASTVVSGSIHASRGAVAGSGT